MNLPEDLEELPFAEVSKINTDLNNMVADKTAEIERLMQKIRITKSKISDDWSISNDALITLSKVTFANELGLMEHFGEMEKLKSVLDADDSNQTTRTEKLWNKVKNTGETVAGMIGPRTTDKIDKIQAKCKEIEKLRNDHRNKFQKTCNIKTRLEKKYSHFTEQHTANVIELENKIHQLKMSQMRLDPNTEWSEIYQSSSE